MESGDETECDESSVKNQGKKPASTDAANLAIALSKFATSWNFSTYTKDRTAPVNKDVLVTPKYQDFIQTVWHRCGSWTFTPATIMQALLISSKDHKLRF